MSFTGFVWDHPDLGDWQYAVANGDTLRGFREWLEYEQENPVQED